MAAICTTMAPGATKSTVATLVNELLAGGVDLRSVSLNEMKRRLYARMLTWGGSLREEQLDLSGVPVTTTTTRPPDPRGQF